jgi:predicted ATPase
MVMPEVYQITNRLSLKPQFLPVDSIAVLTLFLEQIPTSQVFTVLTFRPDFTPPWRARSHITQLTLSRLGRLQVEAMVEKVTGGKALPAEVLQQIISKTDGVPLFVEELTKMVLESGLLREEDSRYVGAHGDAPIPPLAIPSTLQDSLMARLDRLAPVREIAQVAAVLGREFSYELLHAVFAADEETLQQGLHQLVEAELIYQRGLPPQATYLFKHALIQDAAYQSLLKSKRQQFHQQIAQVLEERFVETKETQPELLAHHYSEAGISPQAIPYWQRAGQRAIERSANIEASGYLIKGMELLKTLPGTPERTQQELILQILLGQVLIAVKGFATLEVGQTYARARELCQRMEESPQLSPVLLGLWLFYFVGAEHKTACELGEQLLSLAQRQHDSALLVEAHAELVNTLFFLGEFVAAQAPREQVAAFYDLQQHHSLAFLYRGTDPGVMGLSCAAWTLWFLGYPDQALKKVHDTLTLAQRLSHPFSMGMALNHAAWFYHQLREGELTQERAESAIALANEQGFPYWVAEGTILRGWALAEQGRGEEGVAQVCQGLAAYRATGAELASTKWLALLAEAYGKVGQAQEGLSALAEALTFGNKSGERFYEAELYRLKGELTLQKFQVPSAKLQVQKNQKSKIKRQRAKGKGQRAKGKGQRAKGKGQKWKPILDP